MSSIRDVIARGSVDELAEFMATRRGARMGESELLWAVSCDSVDIVKEWMTPELEPLVMDGVIRSRPGKVLEWLIKEGRLVVPDPNEWGVHCEVWLRLLRLDKDHPCYAGEFENNIRTRLIADTHYVVESFIREAVKKFTLEELEWLEGEFGDEGTPNPLWSRVLFISLASNPHADVVERFYDPLAPEDEKDVWDIIARSSTPEVAEVIRRKIPKVKPTATNMCDAMCRGNLPMYRWIGLEFGKVVKHTKRMFLGCCENGEPDDIRDYWLDDPKAVAQGAVVLFSRGMCELVEEIIGKSQVKIPDPTTFMRAVRMRSNNVRVLQGIVLMEWGGSIRMTKALAKDLNQTAQKHGYWPWFQGAIHTGDIYFTRAEILAVR